MYRNIKNKLEIQKILEENQKQSKHNGQRNQEESLELEQEQYKQ